MKKTNLFRLFLLTVSLMLIAAVALSTVSCSKGNSKEPDEASKNAERTVKGEGATVFYLDIADYQGEMTYFEIHTDEKTVGAALIGVGLIEGDKGPYGLYVKVVNGISADYDKDGKYWAFYEGGTMAMSGADMTDIKPGETYAFRVE